jgi:hypothetical protein
MMKYHFVVVGLAALTLSACTITTSTTVNQNRWIKKEVSAEKLANGKQLMIGYRKPVKANQCRLVGKDVKNWAHVKFKGQFKPHFGKAGYNELTDIAVAYANKQPSVNYAYLFIPNTTSIMGFETNTDADAVLRYYSCKNPPKKHSNL